MNSHSHSSPSLPAQYCSGQRLKREPAKVYIQQAYLLVILDEQVQHIPLNTIGHGEVLGDAPIVLHLACGATLEFDQTTCKETLQQWKLLSPSCFEKITSKAFIWMSCTLAAIAVASVTYLYALPAVGGWIAFKLPQSTLDTVFGNTLPVLDEFLFTPSTLPEPERARHRTELVKLLGSNPDLSHIKLEFRSLDSAPNAFALPDGTIVLTDELERLLSAEQVAGVLAHEIGHIAMRHSARQIIQNATTSTLLLAFTGDVSLIFTAVLTQIADQHYSREFEREADAFAIDLFLEQGRDLAALEQLHNTLANLDKSPNTTPSYLSSHPGAEERIRMIQQHR